MLDSKKSIESENAAGGGGGPGGGDKRGNANVKVKNFESNNVANYSGKLKIKLGGGNTTIQSEKSGSAQNQDGSSAGPEGGLAFSFAGKPTYSPSRIEPSSSSGTTVQSKGESLFFLSCSK